MVLTIIGFLLLALVDLPPLLRKRDRRAVVAFSIFFLAALALGLLRAFHVEVPSVLLLLGEGLKKLGIGYTS
jgi:hypothetical protein